MGSSIYPIRVKLMAGIEELLRRAWVHAADAFPAYALVMPGDASFICQAQECNAYCCRAFSVPLGEREVTRLARTSGLPRNRFLEGEGGEPLILPLVQPYLLVRNEGSCALLRNDAGCGQYEGRPDACRMYPHQLLVLRDGGVTAAGATEVRGRLGGMALGFSGEPTVLLLKHVECPGFTGPPLTDAQWFGLLHETCELQFPTTSDG
jgi:Fe-S-cluster containining protein